MSDSCETCKFFRKDKKPDQSPIPHLSVCQRYPEYICRVKDDWCGEYQESSSEHYKRTSH